MRSTLLLLLHTLHHTLPRDNAPICLLVIKVNLVTSVGVKPTIPNNQPAVLPRTQKIHSLGLFTPVNRGVVPSLVTRKVIV